MSVFRWVAAAALLLASSMLPPTAAQAVVPSVLLGSYDGIYAGDLGQPGLSAWQPRTQAMQSWQGKNDALTNLYASWNDSTTNLSYTLNALWNTDHSVPSLSWALAGDPSENALIANGLDDNKLNPFVTMLKTFLAGSDGIYGNADDRRLYLRLDWEANGDWYGYSPDYNGLSGHPTDLQYQQNVGNFKAMWQHVHDLFVQAGIGSSRLAWIFSVESSDAYRLNPSTGRAQPIMEDIYPGDAYVDWVGIDGYNMGTATSSGWQTPDQIFDSMITRLQAKAPNKPIAVTEVGCTTNGSTVANKGTWISSYFSWLRGSTGGGNIGMTMWFNQDKTQGSFFVDNAVFGGANGDSGYPTGSPTYNTYSVYQGNVGGDSWLAGADTNNSRLMTDAAFLGQ
jgi:mannan endo-1,4-beta-mannosidase